MRRLVAALGIATVGCSLVVSTSGLSGNKSAQDGGVVTGGSDGGDDARPNPPPDGGRIDARPSGRYEQEVLADLPIAFYALDESAGSTVRSTVGGPEGRVFGARFAEPGAVQGSNAVVLDGASGRIDFGDAFAFGGTAAFSIELWTKPSTVDGQVRFLISRMSASGSDGYGFYFTSSFLIFSRTANGTEMGYASSQSPMAANAWTHIVASFDGSQDALYVNGELKASGSAEPIQALPGVFAVGDSANGQFFRFAGALDEIAVYDHALSAARAAHYAAR